MPFTNFKLQTRNMLTALMSLTVRLVHDITNKCSNVL